MNKYLLFIATISSSLSAMQEPQQPHMQINQSMLDAFRKQQLEQETPSHFKAGTLFTSLGIISLHLKNACPLMIDHQAEIFISGLCFGLSAHEMVTGVRKEVELFKLKLKQE